MPACSPIRPVVGACRSLQVARRRFHVTTTAARGGIVAEYEELGVTSGRRARVVVR